MALSKEMGFLHDFCQLVEAEPEKLDSLYSELIILLPEAMTHPEKCSCSVFIEDELFGEATDKRYGNCLQEGIIAKGRDIGFLSVSYNSSHIKFTPDECELIPYVCKRLGRIIERYQSENQLEKALGELEEKNKRLEIKNIAMAELLNQINESQSDFKKKIAHDIHLNLLPNLHKLEEQVGSNFYIEMLKLSLSNLVSVEDKLLYRFTRLSQRELECCYLINRGLSSKEIAEKLLISSKTVDKHRANIRKKLGIAGSNKNLFSSLQFIDQN